MPPKRKNPFASSASTTYQKRTKTVAQAPTTSSGNDYHTTNSSALADPSTLPPRAIETIHRSIVSEVTRGNKSVFRAIKKAKGFETRKLIKRIKDARRKNELEMVMKLEKELDAVKAISGKDMDALAVCHILKSLGKKKRIVGSLLWPQQLVVPQQGETKGENEKAKDNVVARLYGSAVVREAVKPIVDAVEGVMGMRELTKDVVQQEESPDEEEGEEQEESEREVEYSDGDRIVIESEEFVGFSDSELAGISTAGEDDMDPWDRVMDPNSNHLAEFDSRIADSDEDDPLDDVNPHHELERTDDEWSGSEADDEKDDRGDTEELSGSSRSVSPQPTIKSTKKVLPVAPTAPKQKKPAKEKPKLPASASSQFLPSLMSGYISGGDSDPDAEYYKRKTKERGPPEKTVRKNRMGQQARRALWEKKFGKEANHIKSEEEERREKQERRDARGGRSGRGGATSAGNNVGRPHEQKKDEGPLHPSWEAARMAKEKQAKAAQAIFKPQGKKITFD